MRNAITIILIIFCSIPVWAQIIKVDQGDLKDLKGVLEYNVQFDYNGLDVNGFETEEAFLEEKMAMREKRKPGDGERFRKSWLADRENLYEPYFVNAFNDFFKMKRKIEVTNNSINAKYTIKVTTKWIYPGYFLGGIAEKSKIKATITIFETSSPSIILFETEPIKCRGMARPNAGHRIGLAYALLGNTMANYIGRKTK